MSAARARGRRGQATVEFVLILPLLVLMLVAVADYAHVARETANVQAASSEGARYAAAKSCPGRTVSPGASSPVDAG